MRLVLDTNVALSAFLWRGTPFHLLDAIPRQPEARLFTSEALLEELADVLTRPAAAKRLAAIGRTAQQVLADYAKVADVVFPTAVPSVVSADPDDDQVIAAAVTAGAELIVSGDRHLLDLVRHGEIRIVAPADALRLLGGGG